MIANVHLENWGRTVMMQVLHLDSEYRGKGELYREGGMVLSSSSCPCLSRDVVFLQGAEYDLDDQVSTYLLDTEEYATEYRKKVANLISNWMEKEEARRKDKLELEENIFSF